LGRLDNRREYGGEQQLAVKKVLEPLRGRKIQGRVYEILSTKKGDAQRSSVRRRPGRNVISKKEAINRKNLWEKLMSSMARRGELGRTE